jgi:hypothetical protein
MCPGSEFDGHLGAAVVDLTAGQILVEVTR